MAVTCRTYGKILWGATGSVMVALSVIIYDYINNMQSNIFENILFLSMTVLVIGRFKELRMNTEISISTTLDKILSEK